MVEMLFVEGNYFCLACEKSGDCDLQGLGYWFGVIVICFFYLFVNWLIDYWLECMVIDYNCCIWCWCCVEEVYIDVGKVVFFFVNCGKDIEVVVDYKVEIELIEVQVLQVMYFCFVGVILVCGKSLAWLVGEWKYD